MSTNQRFLNPSLIQYLKQDSEILKDIGLSWMEVLIKKILLWDLRENNLIKPQKIAATIQSKLSLQSKSFLIFLGKKAIQQCDKYQKHILNLIQQAICQNKFSDKSEDTNIIELSDGYSQISKQYSQQSFIIQKQLDSYFSNILIPNSEMNIFCQKMKIDFPTFKIDHNGQMYDVVGAITVKDDKHDKILIYSANSRYPQLKNCKNSVSLSLLKQIFSQNVEIWQRFMKKKSRVNRKKQFF